jgi:hypothetical protein
MAKKEKAKNSGVKRDKDLVRELTDLLPDIREEGLRFLINQARVLLHNQQVEKVNLEMEKLRNLERRKGSGAAPASSAQAAGGGVDIEESKDGGNFIMVLSPARKFLNREEMRALVKICRAADGGAEAAPRLYRWLGQHRQDILLDAGVSAKNDPRLAALGELVRGRYTVAGDG